jgi:DNA-directed RNA polymerase II subunit RPB2
VCVQTPEHAKVGLTKTISIIGTITILQTSQIALIESFLKGKVTNIQDIASNKLKEATKVFLNGEWLGISNDPFILDRELRANKVNGTFDPTISVVHDIMEKEIRVYCDGGRGYAPAIRVKDNVIALTREHINAISLNRSDKDKVTSWDEFMIKYPGIIEYVDMEEQPYRMFADRISTVEEMRKRMVQSIDKVKDVTGKNINNRYDDMMFVRYTHCEFHPSFLLGEIATNIPFCNCNAGPRNIFQSRVGNRWELRWLVLIPSRENSVRALMIEPPSRGYKTTCGNITKLRETLRTLKYQHIRVTWYVNSVNCRTQW